MSDETSLFLTTEQFIPGDQINNLLGRLCINPHEPLADSIPDSPSQYYDPKGGPIITSSIDAEAYMSRTKASGANLNLAEMINVAFKNNEVDERRMKSSVVRTFKLQQHTRVFDNMMRDPKTRVKVEDWIQDVDVCPEGKLYMCVGYSSCVGAEVQSDDNDTASLEFAADMGKMLATALSGNPLAAKAVPDVKVGAFKSGGEHVTAHATFVSENIFSVRYREVVMKNQSWRCNRWLLWSKQHKAKGDPVKLGLSTRAAQFEGMKCSLKTCECRD